MSRKHRFLLSLAILVAGIGIFTALLLTRPQQEAAHSQERVWYVDTVKVDPRSLSPTQKLYGQTETPDLIKATAPSTSTVQTVFVREGDRITSGELLIRLDARDFSPLVVQKQARVSELEAMIESEKLHHANNRKAVKHQRSLLQISQAALDRAVKMKAKNLGSEASLDQARQAMELQKLSLNERLLALNDHPARLQQLEARLQHAQAELDLAQLDLERSEIRAPFEGFVSAVEVSAGDHVKAGQLLVSFYPTDTLEIRTLIPASLQTELQAALSAGIPLGARADYGGNHLLLSLDRLSGAADTRGIDALFRLKQTNLSLRAGTSLGVFLLRPSHPDAVILPYSALYGKDTIYRLEDGRMRSLHVTNLGNYTDEQGIDHLLVSSPALKSGDEVIITHLPNAVNGLKVEPRNPVVPKTAEPPRPSINPAPT